MTTQTQTQSRTGQDAIQPSLAALRRLARRSTPSAIVLVGWLLLRSLRNHTEASLQNEAFATGYSLASICVLLLLLGVRKRILTVPLGRMAVWQMTHQYVGLLSVAAYALHASFITTGWLESMLALNFWAIAMSGIIGWYVNRTAPRLLRAAGTQILRQDIPERSRSIAKQAHELALASAGNNNSAALADHYRIHLKPFFESRRSLFYRIFPTGNKRRTLLAELENLDRYLGDEGRKKRTDMSKLVQSKDDLDFQRAVQNRIRLWAAAHTWVLGSFVILAIAHIVAAHQFTIAW